METLTQRMALSALARVESFGQDADGEAREKYRTMALKLPILILADGLAQSLTFVEARGEAAQRHLLDDLATTVSWPDAPDGKALASRSRAAELKEYMALTRRVLAALVWYKRFADSVLKRSNMKPVGAAVAGEGARNEA